MDKGFNFYNNLNSYQNYEEDDSMKGTSPPKVLSEEIEQGRRKSIERTNYQVSSNHEKETIDPQLQRNYTNTNKNILQTQNTYNKHGSTMINNRKQEIVLSEDSDSIRNSGENDKQLAEILKKRIDQDAMNQFNTGNSMLPPIKTAMPRSTANVEISDIPFNQPQNLQQNKPIHSKKKSNKVGVTNEQPARQQSIQQNQDQRKANKIEQQIEYKLQTQNSKIDQRQNQNNTQSSKVMENQIFHRVTNESPAKSDHLNQFDLSSKDLMNLDQSATHGNDSSEIEIVQIQMNPKKIKRAQIAIQILGALIQMGNIGFNISYFLVAEFDSNTMYYLYQMFLILRPIIIAVFMVYYVIIIMKRGIIEEQEYNNRIRNTDSGVELKVKPKRFECCDSTYYILLYPLILYTGVIRLVSSKKILISKRKSLLLEVFTQTIPLLIVKVYNYQLVGGNGLPIDPIYIILAALNIIDVAAELFIDQHIQPKQEKSVMERILRRRSSICKEICFSNIVSVAIIIGVVIAIIACIGIRTCSSGYYKDAANCVKCSKILGDQCLDCNGPDACTQCADGYYFEPSNSTCIQCNKTLGTSCLECSSSTQCSLCTDGLLIQNGKCASCITGCAQCSGRNCTKCLDGFAYYNETCIQCNKTLPNCVACSSPTQCTQCSLSTYSIINGNCSCSGGQYAKFDTTKKICTCQSDYYKSSDKCSKCEAVIPNCQQCSQSSSSSAVGKLLDDNTTLSCSDCGIGNYLNVTEQKCWSCTHKYNGCANCGDKGNQCYSCLTNYLKSGSGTLTQCIGCNQYMKGCATCTSNVTCTNCYDDYFMVFGACVKKPFTL